MLGLAVPTAKVGVYYTADAAERLSLAGSIDTIAATTFALAAQLGLIYPFMPSPGWQDIAAFNTAGTYGFHCTIHAGMTATLTVQ